MTTNEIESLDPDILALLEHAKPVPALDASHKASLLANVMDKIGTPPPGGGDGGVDGGAGGGGGGGTGAGAGAGAIGSKIALGVAFAIGVAAGVAGDRAMSDRTPVTSASSAPITTIVIPSVTAPVPESPEAVPVGALPSAPQAIVPAAKPSASSAPIPSARGLAAERALLDVARTALARGEASEALDAAERHRREYPDGTLVEEREAIAIKALVALGRRDEAARRLENLERTHPNSLVLRAAKKAVSGSP